ncbi:MAG: hypothetical protein NTY33_03990 [Candidatus Moranbacteria bacterium]|nr:hypothetical protein [Candidatus Moranbacteria bacterium]
MNQIQINRYFVLGVFLMAAPFIVGAIVGFVYLGFWKTVMAFALVAVMIAPIVFGFKLVKSSTGKKKDALAQRMRNDIDKLRREA